MHRLGNVLEIRAVSRLRWHTSIDRLLESHDVTLEVFAKTENARQPACPFGNGRYHFEEEMKKNGNLTNEQAVQLWTIMSRAIEPDSF
jgi:hypothetical protein